jgi:8-oxo-dGTP diphosphatase
VTAPAPTLVVGVAIVHVGRLLIARRTGPAELAGKWELPGGKVEPGESIAEAAVREIAEELGLPIVVTAELPDRYPLSAAHEMGVVRGTVATPREPSLSGSHDSVQWLAASELDAALSDPAFAWVPADVPAVMAVRAAHWLAAV